MNTPSSSTAEVEMGIDITAETCPMTFVRVRLALDRLPPGARLAIRLRGEEPLLNVPRTAIEQGHTLLSRQQQPDGTTVMVIRKKL